MRRKNTVLVALVLSVAAIAVGYGWHLHQVKPTTTVAVQYKTPQEAADVYVRFDMEAYDTMLANFWKQAGDADMAQLFEKSVQKAANSTDFTLASSTRAGTATMLAAALKKAGSPDAEKALALQILQVALYNLPPAGRDQLLSTAQAVQLKNEVTNVNPNNDLYQNLGVASGATSQQVDAAYTQKKAQLEGTTSPEGKAALKKVTYAHEVLTSATAKAQYDTTKVEPTIFIHTLASNTLYLYISKIAPTTINELIQALEQASTTPDTSLILDFRGNLGGDLSFAQNVMSLFLGPNAYAFDLYHQGGYDAQRTPVFGPLPALAQYKDIAVLTDNMTQSTAELTSSSLRRFRLGYIVGTKTRGWGSVEKEFPMQTIIDPKEQYALLLVIDLTLGDDQQPIEQNGVKPDVDTSVAGWQNRLLQYFHSPSLIQALKQEATIPPLQ